MVYLNEEGIGANAIAAVNDKGEEKPYFSSGLLTWVLRRKGASVGWSTDQQLEIDRQGAMEVRMVDLVEQLDIFATPIKVVVLVFLQYC